MPSLPETSRAILPIVPVFRKTKIDNGIRMEATGDLLPFLLEQLISTGSTHIVITDGWRYTKNTLQVPNIWLPYIVFKDLGDKPFNQAKYLLGPILQKLNIEAERAVVSYTLDDTIDKKVRDTAVELLFMLEKYLTAMHLRSQFHFNTLDVLERLLILRSALNDFDSVAHLSCLTSLFSSYQPITIDGLELAASPKADIAAQFHQSLRLNSYNRVSQSRFALGWIDDIGRVAERLAQSVRELLMRPHMNEVINFASQSASVVTNLPTPSTDLLRNLLSNNYLPPAIDLSIQIEQASRNLSDLHDSSLIIGSSRTFGSKK